MQIIKRFILIDLLLTIGITLDQLTKWIFSRASDISIIGNILTIHPQFNTGIAFSMPLSGIILSIVTVLAIVAIGAHFVLVEWKKNSRILDIGYALLLAWGISHAFDRIVFGRVFDFIRLEHFAIFNIADIIITLWSSLIIWFYYKHGGTR